MSKASDTRRIRNRANRWRSLRISKEEANRQIAIALKRPGTTREALLAEALDNSLRGLRRAMSAKTREQRLDCAMGSYWREQIMQWLAHVRVAKSEISAA